MANLLDGTQLLTWAALALSLFNMVLLLWLAFTVLLNAERRRWGIWVAGGGLLSGAALNGAALNGVAFFTIHSAMLGQGLTYISWGMDFWWHVGWIPVLAAPYAWYVVMLWYAGYWDDTRSPLRRIHRFGLAVTSLLALGLAAYLTLANPLPTYWQAAQHNLSGTPGQSGIATLMTLFPVYMVLCIALSLDALRRPVPSGRVMGDIARRRARPWLMSTSGVLLLMSLIVIWAMLWIVGNVAGNQERLLNTIAQFDIAISALIGVAVVLVGQATVAYEIFTGKTLPRSSLVRQWRSAVVLALGYSALVGYSLTLAIHPIYGLLPATILMVLFYALFGWRSYSERERYMNLLRPFVIGGSLYEGLLGSGAGTARAPASLQEVDIERPFRALCGEVLGAKLAYLVPLGPLSPLAGPPLVYSRAQGEGGDKRETAKAEAPQPALSELAAHFSSPQTMCVPVDPARFNGAEWAVPLWSERGLIGVMLLGAKYDNGLYTQEEIEIARASGERLVDTQASTEMARRLMSLQRRRLAESLVLDRQARRVLHDDVLPLLHTAMITLSSPKSEADLANTMRHKANGAGERGHKALDGKNGVGADGGDADGGSDGQGALSLLADAHRRISDLLRDMPAGAAPQVERLGLFGALQKAVSEEFGSAFNGVEWSVGPAAEQLAARISPLAGEVVYYAAREAVRNAARYGRDAQRPLHLRIEATANNGLQISIEDDGVGMATARRGDGDPSTVGSGQGLVLHSTMMAVVGGSLSTESAVGRYTRITLTLPA